MNPSEGLTLHKPVQPVLDENGNLLFDYTPENGQITMETEFGKHLVKLAADPQYTTYFEVGTWKGNGTTRCLAEGIYQRYKSDPNSLKNVHCWSLESNLFIYREATYFWLQAPLPFLHLLYGKLHENGLLTPQEIKEHPRFDLVEDHYKTCYEQDEEAYKLAPCLDMSLFPDLDILVLDGGEFSGYADWFTLKQKNPKVVCLDDINVLKNDAVYKELQNDPQWELLVKDEERFGFAIFKRRVM